MQCKLFISFCVCAAPCVCVYVCLSIRSIQKSHSTGHSLLHCKLFLDLYKRLNSRHGLQGVLVGVRSHRIDGIQQIPQIFE